MVAAKTFFNTLGVSDVTYGVSDTTSYSDFNFLYLFNVALAKLSKLPTFCLLVGVNPRFETPLLNLRLIKLVTDYNVQIYKIGVTAHYSAFQVKHLSGNLKTFFDICEFKHVFCKNFYLFKFLIKPFILLGQAATSKLGGLGVTTALLSFLVRLTGLQRFLLIRRAKCSEFLMFGFLSTYSGRIHAFDLGLNRGILNFTNSSVLPIVEKFNNYVFGDAMFYSVGYDESVAYTRVDAFTERMWVVYQGTHGVGMARLANLVFPTISYVEKSVVFKNLMGLAQHSSLVISYDFNAKSDIEVFRSVLGIFLGGFFSRFAGFDFYSGVVFNLNLLVDVDFFLNSSSLFIKHSALSSFFFKSKTSVTGVSMLLMGDFFLKAVRIFKLKSMIFSFNRLVSSSLGRSKAISAFINSTIMNYYGDNSVSLLSSSKTMSLCSNLYARKNFSFSHAYF